MRTTAEGPSAKGERRPHGELDVAVLGSAQQRDRVDPPVVVRRQLPADRRQLRHRPVAVLAVGYERRTGVVDDGDEDRDRAVAVVEDLEGAALLGEVDGAGGVDLPDARA